MLSNVREVRTMKSCFAIIFALLAIGSSAVRAQEDEQEDTTVYKFATLPRNITTKRDDTVRIPCDVVDENGAPVPVDSDIVAVWLYGQRALFAGTTRLIPDKHYSVDGRTLVITGVKESHAGQYTCQISSSQSMLLHQTLIVLGPPVVKAVKETVVAKSGENVSLQCEASGSPEPKIRWKKRSGPGTNLNQELSGNGTLVLEKVTQHQAGNYSCEADNGIGGPVVANIRLDVLFKPIVTIEKQWIHSGENSQAELTCEISAQPQPKVQWLKDGVELDPETPHWTQTRGDGSDIYTLELKNLKREHFGTYECRASNDLGSDVGMIELSGVAHKAVFVSNPNGDKPNAYTLRWTVESYSPVKEYVLKYRRVKANESTGMPGEWTMVTVPGEDGAATASRKHAKEFVLRNLVLATEYEVSVQVVNMFGPNKPTNFKFATLGSSVARQAKDGGSTIATSWLSITAVLLAIAHSSLAPLMPRLA